MSRGSFCSSSYNVSTKKSLQELSFTLPKSIATVAIIYRYLIECQCEDFSSQTGETTRARNSLPKSVVDQFNTHCASVYLFRTERLWAPIFTEKMANALAIEQDEISFRCTVSAKPLPSIVWLVAIHILY